MSVAEKRGTLSLTTATPQQTEQLGQLISGHCRRGDCIALNGSLGVGKTVFTRGFIRGKSAGDAEVTSPTFTLVQTYEIAGAPTIWHFDLFRLEDGSEILETGLEEALEQGITLIEWPDMAKSWLPQHTLHITIAYGSREGERQVQIKGDSHWATCFNQIESIYKVASIP